MSDSHGYAEPKTNQALEAIGRLGMTEYDFRRLAAACADQGGVSRRDLEKLEQLLGLVP